MSDSTLTHITGSPITVGGGNGYVIQRCALCGGILIDSRGQSRILNPDGTDPGVPTWEPGRLLKVTLGNPTSYTLLSDQEQLPDDSCVDTI